MDADRPHGTVAEALMCDPRLRSAAARMMCELVRLGFRGSALADPGAEELLDEAGQGDPRVIELAMARMAADSERDPGEAALAAARSLLGHIS